MNALKVKTEVTLGGGWGGWGVLCVAGRGHVEAGVGGGGGSALVGVIICAPESVLFPGPFPHGSYI